MVNRHYLLLLLAMILSGCGDKTTKSDVSVSPDTTADGYWIIKADIRVEAKNRADAITRVIPVFEALTKTLEQPPVPAEKSQ